MTLKLQRQTRKPSVDSEPLFTPGWCGLVEHKELCPAYLNRVSRSEISLSVSRKRQPNSVYNPNYYQKSRKSCFKLRVQCSLLLSFLTLKLYLSYGWPCFSLCREMRPQTPHIHHGRDSHPQAEDQGTVATERGV